LLTRLGTDSFFHVTLDEKALADNYSFYIRVLKYHDLHHVLSFWRC